MSIKLEHQTVASCSPEQVWSVFSRLEEWPQWSRLFARTAWMGEPWQLGSEIALDFSQPLLRVTGKVVECTPPRRFVIRGGAMGVNVEHWFDFQPQETGTLMRSGIDLSGPATFFINKEMQRKGLESFSQWFESLRAEAEQNGPKT